MQSEYKFSNNVSNNVSNEVFNEVSNTWKQNYTLAHRHTETETADIRIVEFIYGDNWVIITEASRPIYPLYVTLKFPDDETTRNAKLKLLKKYPSLHQPLSSRLIVLNVERWDRDFVGPFLFDIINVFGKDKEILLSLLEAEIKVFAGIRPWEEKPTLEPFSNLSSDVSSQTKQPVKQQALVEHKSNQIWSHVESFRYKPPHYSVGLNSSFRTSLKNPIEEIFMKYNDNDSIIIYVHGMIQLNNINNTEKILGNFWKITCDYADIRNVVKQICSDDRTGLLLLLNTELDILEKYRKYEKCDTHSHLSLHINTKSNECKVDNTVHNTVDNTWKKHGTLAILHKETEGGDIRTVRFAYNNRFIIHITQSIRPIYPLCVVIEFPDDTTTENSKSKLVKDYPSLYQPLGSHLIILNVERWDRDFVGSLLFDLIHLFQQDRDILLSLLEAEIEVFSGIQPWEERPLKKQKLNQIWSHVQSFRYGFNALFRTSLKNPIEEINIKYNNDDNSITVFVDGNIQINNIHNAEEITENFWKITCKYSEIRDVVKQICKGDPTGLLLLLNNELDILDQKTQHNQKQ